MAEKHKSLPLYGADPLLEGLRLPGKQTGRLIHDFSWCNVSSGVQRHGDVMDETQAAHHQFYRIRPKVERQ